MPGKLPLQHQSPQDLWVRGPEAVAGLGLSPVHAPLVSVIRRKYNRQK